MSAKKIVIGVAIIAAAGVGVYAARDWLHPTGAVAQSKAPERTVAVEVAKANRKQVPVQIEALGTVTPMASVNIKPRLDTSIVSVDFADGAAVNKGDVLFRLDSRAIEAQIKQVEGMLARDNAQFDDAQRNVRRYTELVQKSATPVTNLDNAKTQERVFAAAIKSDEAQLENLHVQLTYCTIVAPIAGRISTASVKAGNFVRSADPAPLATLIQIAPVYVTFQVPQNNLPELRKALDAGEAALTVTIPGEERKAHGKVEVIENTVDPVTGMVTLRAVMPNDDALLWPGTLVTASMTMRSEEEVIVPSTAVQVSQSGNYVFVVKDGRVAVQKVTAGRIVDGDRVIETGLKGDETVVTEGQLLLSNGTKVSPRPPKAQS
jgi:multidrug efflux system membrane fusion protein